MSLGASFNTLTGPIRRSGTCSMIVRWTISGAVPAACVLAAIVPSAQASARPAGRLIRAHSITGRLIKAGSLPGSDIKTGTLSASRLSPGSIGQGLTMIGGALAVNPLLLSPFQRRVTGTCPAGQAIQVINADGTVGCQAMTGGGGTVTSLSQGTGILLSPNPITTTGTIAANTSVLQARVSGTPCPSGEAISAVDQSGAATCVSVGTGTAGVTALTAGTGLNENQSTGDVTLNLDNPLSLTGSSSAAILEGLNSSGDGVHGSTSNVNHSGVYGDNTGGGKGVFGVSSGGVGVDGQDNGAGDGGYFSSASGTGLVATGADNGIQAINTGNGTSGVTGLDTSAGGGYGGYFNSTNGTGVNGVSGAGGDGVYGRSSSGPGVYGQSVDGTGGSFTATNSGDGVYGSSDTGNGVYGYSSSGWAGYFQGGVLDYGNLNVSGDVTVPTGNLSVGGAIYAGTKDFRIDDPLDPANKFLIHTSVESPDAEDIYNGNITTDGRGYATVQLPPYFDAENTDPRYQLTVIGSFARAVVWRTEHDNRFVIRTDQPRVQVSWQITGIRNDPYARSQRGPAEQPKPLGERGRYLYPQGYGKSARYEIPR